MCATFDVFVQVTGVPAVVRARVGAMPKSSARQPPGALTILKLWTVPSVIAALFCI